MITSKSLARSCRFHLFLSCIVGHLLPGSQQADVNSNPLNVYPHQVAVSYPHLGSVPSSDDDQSSGQEREDHQEFSGQKNGGTDEKYPSLDVIFIDPYEAERLKGLVVGMLQRQSRTSQPSGGHVRFPSTVASSRLGMDGKEELEKLLENSAGVYQSGTEGSAGQNRARAMLRFGGSHGRMPKRPAFSPWGGKRDTAAVIAVERYADGEGIDAPKRYLARRPFNSWSGKKRSSGVEESNQA